MFGTRIKQARLLAGMTKQEFAASLAEYNYCTTVEAISEYEKNKSFPDAEFLLLASSVLDVPSTYFAHEPAKSVNWLGFRCRQELSPREEKRIRAYASDVAELQIELRDLLCHSSRHKFPTISVSSLDGAEAAAQELREKWEVGNRPLDNLVQTSEDCDLVVISWKDKTGGFDGLAGRCDDRPVAVINAEVPTDRLRFSLAHEIGHLVMDVAEPAGDADEEALANRFAAALLVPAEHARYELGEQRDYINWGELKSLKRKYGLSMLAWVRRACELEIITADTYQSMRDDLESRGWYETEPVEYMGDEEPLQLKQMAQRALSAALVSVDRITSIALDILDDEPVEDSESMYPDAVELLEMDDAERDAWMEKFAEMAEGLEFEEFLPMHPEDELAWQ